MFNFAPPRWLLVVCTLVLVAVGGIAGEGCKYVARHVQIGWKP